MKTFKVILFRKGDFRNNYVLTEFAETEQEAIDQAKRFVAENGWWGILETKPIEERMNRLFVKSCLCMDKSFEVVC